MKPFKKLFTLGIPSVLAVALCATFVSGPRSASAQTPSAADLARRQAAMHRASLRAADRPVGGQPPTGQAPSAIPAGWTCVGTCGTDGLDGGVTLSPSGNTFYEFVSTTNGTNGVGALPTGALGSETNGSTLRTPLFTAAAGTPLNFYFNYVTSDGAGFADYAWAELFNAANTPVALLFTARTLPSGTIVPGSGMPPPNATLTPASVPIIPGGPTWSPLGSSSGQCFSSGCGLTGWVRANYVIPAAGSYYLKVGTTNWSDTAFDSGLAVDGVTVGGVSITATPAPSSLSMLLLAFAAAGVFFVAKMRRVQA